ncbi:MAG: cadherin domain-containing protein [Planctomycetales bacterium]|nr:cadherin domain-containing protein [Planctomycetales bacterium]
MQLTKWLSQILSQNASWRLRKLRNVTRRREKGVVHEQGILECLEARILLTFGSPAFTSSASHNVAENTTAVATVTATDADLQSQTVSFAITGGADSAQFSITSGGVLTFVAAPNFEIPTDTDANNTYDVEVTASDSGTPVLTTVQNVTVTVSDVNELLTLISGSTGSIAENEAVSSVTYTAVAVDPDTTSPNNNITYNIKPGVDDAAFVTINETTGAVTLLAPADFESKSSYLFTVMATDGGSPALSAEQVVTVNVLNQPEGTVENDAFVLTYSSTSVAITVATNGAATTSLGTFPLDAPLTLFGLGGTDSVRVVGTGIADTLTVSNTSLTVNGASLILTSIENRTLAGMAGSDIYQFDADASLGLFRLDEAGGSIEGEAGGGTDTIDLSLTTTANINLSLNLGTGAAQVVHANLSLNLGSSTTFENIVGGSGNDTLTGNFLANTLTGGAGNDTLTGGSGDDSLVGGLGDDTYVFATANAAEAELEKKYQAWVATLTPAQQAWEGTLQAELGSFYLPIHKREKVAGESNAWDFVEDDPALPRVLLIGDSVSRAYTQAVREELTGIANVHRAPANCGPTSYGVEKIDTWLGDGTWDVIHFNFGIHDRETPLADYVTRLEQLVERMQQTGSQLVWASTTPIPDVPGTYSAESIVQRNTAAANLMQEHGVAIDDLFTAITPHLAEWQNPNDVHFSEPGNEFLGKQVATFLKSMIPNQALKLNATSVSEEIPGGSGNETLTGVSGGDSLVRGLRVDTDASMVEADTVTEAANEGTDSLSFSSLTTDVIVSLGTTAVQTVHSNRTLKLNAIDAIENIEGGLGNDTVTGNSLANTLTGNAGSDVLSGGSGDDSLVGGLGDDTYVFRTATTAEADTVAEAANAGTDRLSFSSLTTDVMLSLETSIVQTVHANRSLKLNAGSVFEEIVGGSGNDTLTGNLLANTLTGNAGNDTLAGGSGNDSLVGGSGDDNYEFRTTTTVEADTVAEAANAGSDRLSFSSLTTDVMLSLETSIVQTVHANRSLKLNAGSVFEEIVGGSGNDTLTGNLLANTLTGNAGNDTLIGVSGDDSLVGGLGDDNYVFRTTTTVEADTVAEAANAGTDTLWFSSLTTDVILSLETTAVQTVHANRTLKLNTTDAFENIVGGSGNDSLTGNLLANILVGNAGGDTLSGGGGRDILIGGPGLDTLNGGEDEDILIAGRTTSDAVFSKLNLLLAEWVSVNSYTTRISNLRSSVGAPAVSLKAKVNVLNDAGEDDSLVGGNGTDWYFRALDDVVTGLVTGEIMDIL